MVVQVPIIVLIKHIILLKDIEIHVQSRDVMEKVKAVAVWVPRGETKGGKPGSNRRFTLSGWKKSQHGQTDGL